MSDNDLSQVFLPGEKFSVGTPDARAALVFNNVSDDAPTVALQRGDLDGILRIGAALVGLEDQAALFNHAQVAFEKAPLRKLALIRGRILVHPGLDVLGFIQVTASQESDASLDVPRYFDLMDNLQSEGAATGLWVWGGGDVAAQEITEALRRGHPCAVVKGSGHIADALASWVRQSHEPIDPAFEARIQQMLDEGADMGNLTVIHDPAGTQRWLRRTNLSAA